MRIFDQCFLLCSTQRLLLSIVQLVENIAVIRVFFALHCRSFDLLWADVTANQSFVRSRSTAPACMPELDARDAKSHCCMAHFHRSSAIVPYAPAKSGTDKAKNCARPLVLMADIHQDMRQGEQARLIIFQPRIAGQPIAAHRALLCSAGFGSLLITFARRNAKCDEKKIII